jgi:serine/threonine-protein kinase RsbW
VTFSSVGMSPETIAAMNGDSRFVQLTIPAKAEYITLGRLALVGLSRLHDLPDETLADLKLALTEACSNSIRHAYQNTDGQPVVDIRYELHPDRLVIEVADEGSGFAPPKHPAVSGELSESGLGIAIIRALSDEFELGERADGRGARLRIVKRLG